MERWNVDGAPPNARGIADAHGRLMVVMVHNSDMPDAWEREERTGLLLPILAGSLRHGDRHLLYAMTHLINQPQKHRSTETQIRNSSHEGHEENLGYFLNV